MTAYCLLNPIVVNAGEGDRPAVLMDGSTLLYVYTVAGLEFYTAECTQTKVVHTKYDSCRR